MDRSQLLIAQFSDIHCGDSRFDRELMTALIDEVNDVQPDLVVVAGDLTASGYQEQFEEAHDWISRIDCPQLFVIQGNHDARNVGHLHFDALFGERYSARTVEFPHAESDCRRVRVVCADSSRPDLNQGELGADRYDWLHNELAADPDAFKILAIHHHLVSVPGTGRERNILWDAGDILQILSESHADLVLSGHKHVPFAWQIDGMVVSTSGTGCTRRTRGRTPPSFNLLSISADEIVVNMRNTGTDTGRRVAIPRLDRARHATRRGASSSAVLHA